LLTNFGYFHSRASFTMSFSDYYNIGHQSFKLAYFTLFASEFTRTSIS